MKESEERSSNIDEQKARIRQRYKGIDPEELEVIPALPPEDIFKTEKKKMIDIEYVFLKQNQKICFSHLLFKSQKRNIPSKTK